MERVNNFKQVSALLKHTVGLKKVTIVMSPGYLNPSNEHVNRTRYVMENQIVNAMFF